jgi:tRNA A37 threonylcarbamoyltransferase TsaD
MLTLGIETSCDETALALIETRTTEGTFECRVIESLILSQAELHSAYGGVFPTLAKREHAKNIIPLLKELFDKAQIQNAEKPKAISKDKFKEILESFRVSFKGQNPELLEAIKKIEENKEAKELFENIQKEMEEKTKAGMDQTMAMMGVMMKHKAAIVKHRALLEPLMGLMQK